MKKVRFEAELMQGHKGVMFVLVPFDPEEQWSRKPVRLAGRRHGWLILGTAKNVGGPSGCRKAAKRCTEIILAVGPTSDGVRFEGYIGDRWNRFFIMIDAALRDLANLKLGDTVEIAIEPTSSPDAFARAYAQSKVTTQPKKARVDAMDFESSAPNRRGTHASH